MTQEQDTFMYDQPIDNNDYCSDCGMEHESYTEKDDNLYCDTCYLLRYGVRPEKDTIMVSWYEHDCQWISKYCEEYHKHSASIPLA